MAIGIGGTSADVDEQAQQVVGIIADAEDQQAKKKAEAQLEAELQNAMKGKTRKQKPATFTTPDGKGGRTRLQQKTIAEQKAEPTIKLGKRIVLQKVCGRSVATELGIKRVLALDGGDGEVINKLDMGDLYSDRDMMSLFCDANEGLLYSEGEWFFADAVFDLLLAKRNGQPRQQHVDTRRSQQEAMVLDRSTQ